MNIEAWTKRNQFNYVTCGIEEKRKHDSKKIEQGFALCLNCQNVECLMCRGWGGGAWEFGEGTTMPIDHVTAKFSP